MWIFIIGQLYSFCEDGMTFIAQVVCKITHVWMLNSTCEALFFSSAKVAMRFRFYRVLTRVVSGHFGP